jgi:hypothetical protein
MVADQIPKDTAAGAKWCSETEFSCLATMSFSSAFRAVDAHAEFCQVAIF